MKKLLKALIIMVSVLLIVGCSSGQSNNNDNNTEKIKIGYSVQTLANPYFVTVVEGFEAYAEEKGIEVFIADGKQDAAAQVSQIENFIAQGVDAILISPVNGNALEDVVQQEKDAGIVVVAGNQDFPGSEAFVTIPEYELGKSLGDVTGQYIAANWDESEEVEVLVFDYPEIESIIARGDGIREGILEYAPNAKIVQSISANTPEKGAAAMESALQKFPNVQVVAGVNDAAILGAYEIVMGSGSVSEKFYMGGMDATDQALELISQDTIYRTTIDINPKGTGKIFIDTILDVIANGPSLVKRFNERSATQIESGYDFFDLVRSKNQTAVTLLDEFVDDIHNSIISLCNIYDPEKVIIGGGLIDTKEIWWEKLMLKIESSPLNSLFAPVVVAATLGNKVGIYGAAYLGFNSISVIENID